MIYIETKCRPIMHHAPCTMRHAPCTMHHAPASQPASQPPATTPPAHTPPPHLPAFCLPQGGSCFFPGKNAKTMGVPGSIRPRHQHCVNITLFFRTNIMYIKHF